MVKEVTMGGGGRRGRGKGGVMEVTGTMGGGGAGGSATNESVMRAFVSHSLSPSSPPLAYNLAHADVQSGQRGTVAAIIKDRMCTVRLATGENVTKHATEIEPVAPTKKSTKVRHRLCWETLDVTPIDGFRPLIDDFLPLIHDFFL